jgi:hypothetical protein
MDRMNRLSTRLVWMQLDVCTARKISIDFVFTGGEEHSWRNFGGCFLELMIDILFYYYYYHQPPCEQYIPTNSHRPTYKQHPIYSTLISPHKSPTKYPHKKQA